MDKLKFKFKIFILVFILSLGLIFFAHSAFAVTYPSPKPSLIPTPASEVNSFELFWPIVAGRTRGDSLYNLKTFKEKVRGYIIFGVPQKADYYALLVTKRSVEAEKLLKEGKDDIAKETINDALANLSSIDKSVSDNSSFPSQTLLDFNLKMGKLETFLPWLSMNYKGAETELQDLFGKVKSLNTRI